MGHTQAALVNQKYTELYSVVNQDQHGHFVHGNLAEMMFSRHVDIRIICLDLILTELTISHICQTVDSTRCQNLIWVLAYALQQMQHRV